MKTSWGLGKSVLYRGVSSLRGKFICMLGTQQGILNTGSGVLILGVPIKRGSNVCAIVFCLYVIVIICLKESNSLAPYLALLYSAPPSITAPTD